MKAKCAAALVCRLLALVGIFWCVAELSPLFGLILMAGDDYLPLSAITGFLVAIIFMVFVWIWLWRNSDSIASRMFEAEDASEVPKLQFSSLLATGISVLGILFLSMALNYAAVIVGWKIARGLGDTKILDGGIINASIRFLIFSSIGLWMLLRPNTLVGFLHNTKPQLEDTK